MITIHHEWYSQHNAMQIIQKYHDNVAIRLLLWTVYDCTQLMSEYHIVIINANDNFMKKKNTHSRIEIQIVQSVSTCLLRNIYIDIYFINKFRRCVKIYVEFTYLLKGALSFSTSPCPCMSTSLDSSRNASGRLSEGVRVTGFPGFDSAAQKKNDYIRVKNAINIHISKAGVLISSQNPQVRLMTHNVFTCVLNFLTSCNIDFTINNS